MGGLQNLSYEGVTNMSKKDFKQAMKYRFEGKTKEAEAVYRRIILEVPNSPEAKEAKKELDSMKHSLEEYETKKQAEIDSRNADFVGIQAVGRILEVDDEKKMIKFTFLRQERIYPYQAIIAYELIENNGTVSEGGVKGAAVGGLLFGTAGIVAGSVIGNKNQAVCNNMSIRITVNDSKNPLINIPLISQSVKKDSFVYNTARSTANQIMARLEYICSLNEKESNKNTNHFSAADEILKFKGLLDSGIITEEEFEHKKRELLGF